MVTLMVYKFINNSLVCMENEILVQVNEKSIHTPLHRMLMDTLPFACCHDCQGIPKIAMKSTRKNINGYDHNLRSGERSMLEYIATFEVHK